MKTYHEMIQFIVDQSNDRLRYNTWPAVIAISEAYGIPERIVLNDVNFEKEFREKACKEARLVAHRASNEERRLANLAKKANNGTN